MIRLKEIQRLLWMLHCGDSSSLESLELAHYPQSSQDVRKAGHSLAYILDLFLKDTQATFSPGSNLLMWYSSFQTKRTRKSERL